MKYKAIMLDVDGTIIPYDFHALPSESVIKAIQKAQEKVIVCLVTARTYGFLRRIINKLKLKNGYAIVDNGARVVSLNDRKIIYDQPINYNDTEIILQTLQKEKLNFYLTQELNDVPLLQGHFKKDTIKRKAYMFFSDNHYSSEHVEKIMKELSKMDNVITQKTHHQGSNTYGITICHKNATKLHGIEIIKKKINICTDEIIGVGDSYNDLPLFHSSGYKVAMGNAVKELKNISDYIAPTVTEDGVADVINKFILSV